MVGPRRDILWQGCIGASSGVRTGSEYYQDKVLYSVMKYRQGNRGMLDVLLRTWQRHSRES